MTYWNVVEVESALASLASAFGAQTRLIALPHKSAGPAPKKSSTALHLSLDVDAGKPVLVVLGGVHGVEWGSCEIAVNFATDLLNARLSNAPLLYLGQSFTAAQVASILDRIDVVVFPLVNPDGRELSQARARDFEDDSWWRKNRNPANNNGTNDAIGVDINRNYDFLFDVDTAFAPNLVGAGVKDPTDTNFRGVEPFSEPETCNVRWLLDQFPKTRWMIDLHSCWQCVLYPWSDDVAQSADAAENFENAAYDGKRGAGAPGYGEYMPDLDRKEFARLAKAISTGMEAVAQRPHPAIPASSCGPWFGTSYDYAYSRHFVDNSKSKIYAMSIEWGDREGSPNPPWADMEGMFMPEAIAGLVSLCIAADANPTGRS